MSVFDPSTFLDAVIEAPSERRQPLPVGDYTAIIGEPTFRSGEKDGKGWAAMDIPLTIDVPQTVQEIHKLPPTVTVRDGAFLDLTPSGAIDTAPGRNWKIRMYREALDMNKPGDSWSPRKMAGRPVKVKISHETYEGNIQERAAGVARLG